MTHTLVVTSRRSLDCSTTGWCVIVFDSPPTAHISPSSAARTEAVLRGVKVRVDDREEPTVHERVEELREVRHEGDPAPVRCERERSPFLGSGTMLVCFCSLNTTPTEHLVQDVEDMVLELSNFEDLVRDLVHADGLVVFRPAQDSTHLLEREECCCCCGCWSC